jgi:DNA-binding GntR family transcriptional regulator
MIKTAVRSKKPQLVEVENAPGKRTVSASYGVFREIIRSLYDGRYVPGQRLVEADLMRDFRASRFVVREALKMLMAEGVVSIGFNRGAQIPRLSRTDARDTLKVMEWLFALGARDAAAATINDGENRDLLVASTTALLSLEEKQDFFEFGRACSHFFRTMTKLSGNKELYRLLPTLQVHLVRAQFRTYPTAAENLRLPSFKKMSDAVLSGDSDRAEKAVRKHFSNLSQDISKLPDRAFA